MFARRSELTPAQRAHIRRSLWLLLAYVIILPPLLWLRSNRHIGDGISLAMAFAASLPVLGIFASWGQYLSGESDEYHQALTLRRIAAATHVTMGAAIVWGFLQAFGVMPLTETYWIAFMWVVMQGAGGCIAVAARGHRR